MERRTGLTVRSRSAPETLSCTIIRLEQKATVTQLTASSEEISSPPTVASTSASATEKPCGNALTKLSRYTLARNVA